MATLHLTFCGFRSKPYVSVDGQTVEAGRKRQTKGLFLQVSPGKHEIIVCEKCILYKWYWWVLFFNITYPFMCLKGFSGKQVGYDGDCVTVTFRVECANDSDAHIRIVRREISWDQTTLNANYNSLSLQSSAPIYIKSNDLGSKKVLKLKLARIVPFIWVSLIYTCAWASLLIQDHLSFIDIVISFIVEIALLAYAAYKTHKIRKQKSFSDCAKMSRIEISTKNK